MSQTVTKRPGADDTAPESAAKRIFGNIISNYGVVLFLVAMIIVFSIALPSTFPTAGNFRAIIADQSIPAILALAAILPLAAGEFDLSLGAVLGFSAIWAIWSSEAGLPLPLVLVSTLAIGVLCGAINSFLVVKIGVNAFIATLSVATILSGLNLLFTAGSLLTLTSTTFSKLTTARSGGYQVVIVYAVVISLVLWFLVEKTPFGRYLRATGMGRDAAKLSGVRTSRYLTTSFVAAGLIAAFAGFLLASRSGTAPPSLGPEFLLPAYAAAFLGATTIKPGFFNVWGTIIGVLLLAVGSNGLTLFGAQTWVTNVFNGLALMIAVSASVLVTKRRNRGRQ